MSFRKRIAHIVKTLKEEEGCSYTDMQCGGKYTRKQVSSILKGENGVSIEKIEEFLFDVFEVEIEPVTVEVLDKI